MSSYQHHIEIFHRSLKNNHFTVNLLYYYLSTLVGVAFFERHDSKSWVIILRLRISKSRTMCHVMSQYTMGHDGSHTHTQWVLDVVFMMLCWKLAFIGLNFVRFENGPIRKENKNCRVRSFPALCSMLLYAPYYFGIAEVAWIWTTVGSRNSHNFQTFAVQTNPNGGRGLRSLDNVQSLAVFLWLPLATQKQSVWELPYRKTKSVGHERCLCHVVFKKTRLIVPLLGAVCYER